MRLTAADRRARLARRHLLAPAARAHRTEDVAEALVGLHVTDAPTVTLSAYARLTEPTMADIDRALYDDRTLLRMHCMRRTLFAVPTELAPVFHFSTAQAVAARERSSLLKRLREENPDWDADWLAAAEQAALDALVRLGESAAGEVGAGEVSAEVPELRETVTLARGKPYEAKQRVGGWVLRLLAMDGRIRRGRQQGGWTSGQFRYYAAPELPPLDPQEARAELVRRWLASYGPGTTDDVKWWTGWSVTDVRKTLAAVGAVPVGLDEGDGWVLPGDLAAGTPADTGDGAGPPEPYAALLPGLDPTTMGWKHRDWYLDPAHRPLLFDTNGNGGPTVWWNGEIIGGWACRADGEIVWRQLADRGAEAAAAVEAEAARLQHWLGDGCFVPAFPTPLAKELTR
ncbi:winged helix DNA-binding domain-containing protein [Streptomyces armeniacus]|uniref:Winged helix DNA-binding domain-containing protein n=1 Tax=Streptomyces armeniacus TaxID=83291 RepID=A0A345XU96_9ACTN|nr:winged helix DNA-binding domain-containing protein [Streptomyces armeniacus]AXK35212.1 winged helix DNA-binding domain-containing protein [Streptomyces armeniacus]